MVKRFFLLIVCLFGAFFEATVTTLPVLLCLLVVISIHEKSNKIFVLAFISGIILDVMRVDPIGLRSIFYIIFLFLIFLYERKFETDSWPFVLVAVFLGSIIYMPLFGSENILLQSVAAGGFSVLFFFVSRSFGGEKKLWRRVV